MAVGLIAIAFALAAAPDQPQEVVVEGRKPNPDQIICEKVVEAGSRVNIKRRCATRREWEAARQADRNAIDDSMRRALHQNEPPH